MVVRHWIIPTELKQHLGQGRRTAPRMALLWHHMHRVTDRQAEEMSNMHSYLFLRALHEGEHAREIAPKPVSASPGPSGPAMSPEQTHQLDSLFVQIWGPQGGQWYSARQTEER